MTSRLRPHEERSLLMLAALAADEADPAALIERAARAQRWPARLRRPAERLALAFRAGEPLAPAVAGWASPGVVGALRAIEAGRCNAPALDIALARADGAREQRSAALAPLLSPLLSLALASVAAAVTLAAVAPAIHDLVTQSAGLLGGPPPSRALALVAAHPILTLVTIAAAGILPIVTLSAGSLLLRTRAGSAAALRLPVLGAALRERAAADHLDLMASLIAAGVADHEAHALACEAAGLPALRARAPRAAACVRAGEPLATGLREMGLPRHVAAAWLAGSSPGRDIVTLAREIARSSSERGELLAAWCGRVAAGIALAATGGLAFMTIAIVALPLMRLGGGG